MRAPAGLAWLQRRAENVVALLFAVMFVAFILQIVFRYFFNFPVGWTTELTLLCWLWMVLLGSAFVLKEREEIRFDLIYSAAGPRARRVMGMLMGAALVVLYAMSLPAAYRYVSFMKVEKSSYLHLRLDWLYSIYLIFSVAVIVRYAWIVWQYWRGRDPAASDSIEVSSGL
jgi:TRAP-type C4-dicarboxylate transport system permease small subunit